MARVFAAGAAWPSKGLGAPVTVAGTASMTELLADTTGVGHCQ
jgi:hypothetical protein